MDHVAKDPGKLLFLRVFLRRIFLRKNGCKHLTLLKIRLILRDHLILIFPDIVRVQISENRPHPRIERFRILKCIEREDALDEALLQEILGVCRIACQHIGIII